MGCSIRLAAAAALLALAAVLCPPPPAQASPLQYGYYSHRCPNAEAIIRGVVKDAVRSDSGIVADFVRMHFHDCFVRGCDGSILLDSPKKNAEKDAPVNNPSLEGFDVIDIAKAKLEKECRGVVSCADIIAFAARDSLEISSSGKFKYDVPAGRRDGKVSHSADSTKFLPPPTFHLPDLIHNFARKGMSVDDLVVLSGVHTLGKAACTAFESRLYHFSKTSKQDPLLDPRYAEQLKKLCPGKPSDANVSIPMDPTTPLGFDNAYYRNVLSHKALFTSDMALLDSPQTAAKVHAYAADQAAFYRDFARAIVKMGQIGVLTEGHGEVRHNCRRVN